MSELKWLTAESNSSLDAGIGPSSGIQGSRGDTADEGKDDD